MPPSDILAWLSSATLKIFISEKNLIKKTVPGPSLHNLSCACCHTDGCHTKECGQILLCRVTSLNYLDTRIVTIEKTPHVGVAPHSTLQRQVLHIVL